MIFLLFVFSCNIMHTTVEGAESILTQEEKDNIENMCKESYLSKDKREQCQEEERHSEIKKKKEKQEAQQLKDDMGISAPGGDCPKITSFYTLFAKAYCVADNIRKGAQNV